MKIYEVDWKESNEIGPWYMKYFSTEKDAYSFAQAKSKANLVSWLYEEKEEFAEHLLKCAEKDKKELIESFKKKYKWLKEEIEEGSLQGCTVHEIELDTPKHHTKRNYWNGVRN